MKNELKNLIKTHEQPDHDWDRDYDTDDFHNQINDLLK